jgi:uncharacterized membrane protein YkvA (DUF1232 family)
MAGSVLLALAIVVAVWLVAILALVLAGRRSAARELATLIPNLVVLFKGLLRDPAVPRSSKVLLGLAVLWLVSPIDLVPEFVLVAGPLDDAIVAALVLRHVLRRTGPDVLRRHWRGDQAVLDRLAGTRSR